LLASLLFVVTCFIEFAFVLQFHHHNDVEDIDQKDETTTTIRYGELTVTYEPKKEDNVKIANMNITSNAKPTVNVRKIDRVAFVIGLLLFMVFNLVYWLTFSFYDFN
jgi:hypothetical protein